MEYSEKKVNLTELTYQTGRVIATPILKTIFNPIVINRAVTPKDPNRGIIYAPNHMSTLDPFAIISATKDPIHWVALKRFFDAEDSIFNNSKNPFLCQLTRILFTTMGFVPVDRESINLDSLRLMSRLLKEQRNLGIFPEGTTNKHPDLYDIGEIKSGFASLASKRDVWVQPISVRWVNNSLVNSKIIVNFRDPFLSMGMSKQYIIDKWSEEVQEGIDQNKRIIGGFHETLDGSTVKRISLKIK